MLRLDEFLRITDKWEQTDEHRCQLIEKRIRQGAALRPRKQSSRNCNACLICDGVTCDGERLEMQTARLFDEKKLRQLKEEDELCEFKFLEFDQSFHDRIHHLTVLQATRIFTRMF